MNKHWWPVFLSVLICGIIYIPRLNVPLIWDDYGTIVLNTEIERPIPLKEFLTPKYFEFSKEQSWRPMATFSYYVLLRIKGKTPWLLRSLLLSVHIINGLLLAAFLMSCQIPPDISIWASAFFLAHPAHTETLMCLSFNEELLVTLGLLFMLIAHRKQKPVLVAVGYAFAVLSKETGILGMPLIFLCDLLIPPALSLKKVKVRRFAWKQYALLSLIFTGYLWIRFFRLKGPESGSGASLAIPYMERLYYGLSGFVTAVRIFFLPAWLRIEYFALPPDSVIEALLWIVPGTLILGFLAYYFIRLWGKNRTVVFFLLWPFVFLALTSNVVPTQLLNLRLMAERWLYLPYLGACAVLAYALLTPPSRGNGQKYSPSAPEREDGVGARAWVATALLLSWGACGFVRIQDWAREPRLWASLTRIYPWSAKAQEGLGEAYFHGGMYKEALESFRAALWLRESRQDKILAHYIPLERDNMLKWDNPSLYRWIGRTHLKLDNLKDAEGSSWKAVSLEPHDDYTYRLMAYALAQAGEFANAAPWVEQGLHFYPQDDVLLRLRSDIARRKLTVQAGFY